MTPKEKAKELVSKMKEQFFMEHDNVKILKAKQCALICVDEIIKSSPTEPTDDRYNADDSIFFAKEYWQEAKQELEKL